MALFTTFLVLAIVAVTLPVPAMVVFHAAAFTIPITVVVTLSIVTWRHPAISAIDRTRPISLMPSIVTLDGIPITVHPNIIRTRGHRANSHHTRRRRRTDPDS
jgi:uncharacterized protein (DUF58 family)